MLPNAGSRVMYFVVPEGECGRLAQDLGHSVDAISDDPGIIFNQGSVLLILKDEDGRKGDFDHRMDQIEEVRRNLAHGNCSSLTIVSEFYDSRVDKVIDVKVKDLRIDRRYFSFYQDEIFPSSIPAATLDSLSNTLHLKDSDKESIRAVVISLMRLHSYGLRIKVDMRLNPYRLMELVVRGDRRKSVRSFDRIASILTPVRVLYIVVNFLVRSLSMRAGRSMFEKSIPGEIVLSASRVFMPGAMLRAVHFARTSPLQADVTFSIMQQILEDGRTTGKAPNIDWKHAIATWRGKRRNGGSKNIGNPN